MIFDKLWKLERKRSRVSAGFKKDLLKSKNSAERYSIESDEHFELDMIDDEIQGEMTRRLQKKARKLDIPIPSGDGNWVRSQVTGIAYLQESVRYDLARKILSDQRDRLDLQKNRIMLYTSIIAILSSIISILVSFLRK
jgi:hypothetical protein